MVDYDTWTEVGRWSDAISGGLFLLFALFVATRKPKRAQNSWFGLFAGGWGLWIIVRNVPRNFRADHTVADEVLLGLGLLTAAVAIVVLAHHFPSRHRAPVVAPAVASLAVLTLALAATLTRLIGIDARPTQVAWEIAFDLVMAGTTYFVARLAARHGLEADPNARRRLRLVAFAIAVFFAAYAGEKLGTMPGAIVAGEPVLWSIAIQSAVATMVAAWIIAALRGAPARRTGAATVAATILAFQCAGTILAVLFSPRDTNDFGHLGVARMVGIAVLGYAVLRHQLFDIDFRVRVGLTKSTVAAIFIASFFVVSELVAGLLSDRIGLVAGVMTTGLLVFAIAPLQRVASRLTTAAMPDAVPLAERTISDRTDIYRSLVASAWVDGVLSRRESRVLATARAELGITAEQALAIEAEIAQ